MSGVIKKMNLKWTLEMKQLNYLGILPLHFKNLLTITYLVVPPLRNIKNKYKNDDIFTMDVHPVHPVFELIFSPNWMNFKKPHKINKIYQKWRFSDKFSKFIQLGLNISAIRNLGIDSSGSFDTPGTPGCTSP